MLAQSLNHPLNDTHAHHAHACTHAHTHMHA